MRPDINRVITALLLATLVAVAACSYVDGGLVYQWTRSDVPANQRVETIRGWFASRGAAAPLFYVAFVVVEVVLAPIPGAFLYAPGGVVFGGFWGGLLSLIGNVLGAGVACWLMRGLLADWMERQVAGSRLQHYVRRLRNRGSWVVFLLRVNPLTSSDLVSYGAGLAGISVWRVMAGTLFGMAPLCWAQSYFAEGMLESFPGAVNLLFWLALLYLALVVWAVSGMFRGSRG